MFGKEMPRTKNKKKTLETLGGCLTHPQRSSDIFTASLERKQHFKSSYWNKGQHLTYVTAWVTYVKRTSGSITSKWRAPCKILFKIAEVEVNCVCICSVT